MITTQPHILLAHTVVLLFIISPLLVTANETERVPSAALPPTGFHNLLLRQHIDQRIVEQEPLCIPLIALINSLQGLRYNGEDNYIQQDSHIDIQAHDEGLEIGVSWEF